MSVHHSTHVAEFDIDGFNLCIFSKMFQWKVAVHGTVWKPYVTIVLLVIMIKIVN